MAGAAQAGNDPETVVRMALAGIRAACPGMPAVMAERMVVGADAASDAALVARILDSPEGKALMEAGCPGHEAIFAEVADAAPGDRGMLYGRCGLDKHGFLTAEEWTAAPSAARVRVIFLCPWLAGAGVPEVRALCRLAAGIKAP